MTAESFITRESRRSTDQHDSAVRTIKGGATLLPSGDSSSTNRTARSLKAAVQVPSPRRDWSCLTLLTAPSTAEVLLTISKAALITKNTVPQSPVILTDPR